MTTVGVLAKEIGVAALLGTERQALTLPPLDGPLGAALGSLAARPVEARLLGAAAVVLLYRQAGSPPEMDPDPAPAPAAPDPQPECSAATSARLAAMAGGPRRDVLPEALSLLAAAGRRVPDALLPALLQAGRQQKDLRGPLLSVIGRRGRWLAAQNSEWAYAGRMSPDGLLAGSEGAGDGGAATPGEADEVWQSGSRAARVTVLQELRAHAPDRARGLVESTWGAEGSEDRAAFVAALAPGLGPADEPFLESALDDRSREVRRAAADLLARLPGSGLVRRLADRAAPLLTLRRPALGPPVLEASPPTAFDRAWVRDGVEQKSPYGGLGDRAGWLAQMLARTPPGVWESHFGEPPAVLVPAAARGEWADAVILGWGHAAGHTGDAGWSEALARNWLAGRHGKAQPVPFPSRLTGLAAPAFEALALDALEIDGSPLHDLHPALSLLTQYDAPWSERLSRAVVDSVRRRLALGGNKDVHFWHTLGALRQFALRIPPGMADELSAGWAPDGSHAHYLQNGVDEFAAILQFRHDLHEEIG